MLNVFLIGNGFDLHHKLPTKYFDFICVAEYLTSNMLVAPLYVGNVFSKCVKSSHIQECYQVHKAAFDAVEVPFEKACDIASLLQNNMWFKYFSKTLNVDVGWIDFEKEISTVITALDEIICENQDSINLYGCGELPPFVLSNFRFFVDVDDNEGIYPGEIIAINNSYLIEYPHTSGIYIVNKKKIFEELYKELIDFSNALRLYLKCFVENAFDLIYKDDATKKQKLSILKMANTAVSFNYTNTLERFYTKSSTYHIHGNVSGSNIVLGVNPNELDDCGTNDTALIKFKKYYQREVFGTAVEYIKWYRETIGTNTDYRVITIGHSLDETDKDIVSDMFLNAKEIFVTYYNESCRDDYIANIIKIFGNEGYNKFKKDQGLEFIALSNVDQLGERIKPPYYEFYMDEPGEQIVVI